MSHPDDWANGVVNRNYYMTRELVRDTELDVYVIWLLPWTARGMMRSVWRWVRSLFLRKPFKIRTRAFPFHFICARYTRMIVRLLKNEHTVALSYHPVYDIPESLGIPTVYDLVDDLSKHAAYASVSKRLRERYSSIESNPNVKAIFTVNEEICKRYGIKTCTTLKNGYDQEWERYLRPDFSIPYDRPVCVYVGTMNERFDFELLRYIARVFPDIRFVCIGPVWNAKDTAYDACARERNVHFTGRVSHVEKWNWLAHSDIGMIPHVRPESGDFISSTDSMKLYEYLAVGLPVVMRSEGSYADFADTVRVADEKSEWKTALESIRRMLRDADALSKHERRARVSVRDKTWESRVRLLRDSL